jgi:hypothetical protein
MTGLCFTCAPRTCIAGRGSHAVLDMAVAGFMSCQRSGGDGRLRVASSVR